MQKPNKFGISAGMTSIKLAAVTIFLSECFANHSNMEGQPGTCSTGWQQAICLQRYLNCLDKPS